MWVVTIFTGNLSLRIENWELVSFIFNENLKIENWVSFIFNENLDRRILDGWILKISRIHLSQSSQDIYLPIVACNSILIFHRKLERNVARRWTKKKIVVSTRATIFNPTKLNNRPTTPFSKMSLAGLISSYTQVSKSQYLSFSLFLSLCQTEKVSFLLPRLCLQGSLDESRYSEEIKYVTRFLKLIELGPTSNSLR